VSRLCRARYAKQSGTRFLMRVRHGPLATCLFAWLDVHRAAMDYRRSVIKRTLAAFLHKAQYAVVHRWMQHTREQRDRREYVQLLALARLFDRVASWVLDAWVECVGARRAVKVKASHAIGDGRLLAIAFEGFRGELEERRARLEKERLLAMVSEYCGAASPDRVLQARARPTAHSTHLLVAPPPPAHTAAPAPSLTAPTHHTRLYHTHPSPALPPACVHRRCRTCAVTWRT
jgi:hypothetical protein